MPVVSPSLNACGCWWQGNRLFLPPTGCLPAVCVAVPHLPRQLQALPYMPAQFGGWAVKGRGCAAAPSPLRKSRLGAGELSSLLCSEFPLNSRRPHTLEDARQIHPNFWIIYILLAQFVSRWSSNFGSNSYILTPTAFPFVYLFP